MGLKKYFTKTSICIEYHKGVVMVIGSIIIHWSTFLKTSSMEDKGKLCVLINANKRRKV